MECNCAARGKTNYVRENQASNSNSNLVCGFKVCLHVLNLIVTGQYTTDPCKNQIKMITAFESHSKH